MSRDKGLTLDSRLALCAEFVRNGARVADIGTDHAYLPVWLCRIGKCPNAIASDINPEPLARGRETVEQFGMDGKVVTRLSNGLENISAAEADDIVIAGMGGELIADIMKNCAFARDGSKHFILQPMTRSEALIKWLFENGYEIIKRDCCVAAKKCYTVLLVKYTGEITARDECCFYLAGLSPKTNETHRLFVQGQINRLLKQANGDAHFAALAEKLRECI